MAISKKKTEQEIERINSSFYQIDKNEIFDGIKLCRLNTQNLFNSAIQVGADNYGLANSLLILCSEECIKCFVLLSVALGVPVPFEIPQIFSSHQAKHVTGKELHGFVRAFTFFLGLLSKKRSQKIESILGLAFEFFGDNREIEWWDKANYLKNDGLYVDFRNNKFRRPQEISEQTYVTSKEIVNRLLALLEKMKYLKAEDFKKNREN